MRIRTVKPEWLEDERIAGASDAARVLCIGLILMADDYGNGRAHEMFIASRVWPYGDPHETLMKVSKSLIELEKSGFVARYVVNGQRYYSIVNWVKHQKVQHPGKPRVPGPLMSSSGESHESLTPDPDPDPDQDLNKSRTDSTPRPAAKKPKKKRRTVKASDEVREVFTFWQTNTGHTGTTLDAKRVKRIQDRLNEDFSVADLCAAITNRKHDDWLMGRTEKSTTVYDQIKTLLRDAEQVERLRGLTEPPRAPPVGRNEPNPQAPHLQPFPGL